MPATPRPAQHARYGVDGPSHVAVLVGATSTFLAAAAAALAARRRLGWWFLAGGAFEGFRAGTYLYATLRGKLEVWAREVDALHLTGTEQVLDLGCGRGAVLLTVAHRLTTGRAVGLDLWQAKDQSGNTEAAAQRNADVEGLTDRVDLVTGDLRALSFADASFDVVVSSLALHNVPDADDRAGALAEALRVLRPGGRLLLADALHTGAYADALRAAGAEEFLSTQEWEVLSRHTFADPDHAQRVVAEWCVSSYNTERRHSAAAMMPPGAFETTALQPEAARRNPPPTRAPQRCPRHGKRSTTSIIRRRDDSRRK